VETLRAQRVEARWNEDKIEEWQAQHRAGEISMYWVRPSSMSDLTSQSLHRLLMYFRQRLKSTAKDRKLHKHTMSS